MTSSYEIRGRAEALAHLLRTCQEMVQRLQQDLEPYLRMNPVSLAQNPGPISPLRGPAPAFQVVPPDPAWVPILHSRERPEPDSPVGPCGQVGLYLTHPPQDGIKASLDAMRVLIPGEDRWRAPTPQDRPLCSSCLAPIEPFSNTDLDYLSHMLPAQVGAAPTRRTPRARRRSGEDRGERALPSGSRPTDGTEFSPVSRPPMVDPGLPSTFAGHTPEATGDILEDIQRLQRLANESGLFDDRRLQQP